MNVSSYLQTGYRKAWAERRTVTWAALALLSRIAPLSAMPLMLMYSPIQDADQYALILANSSILSIVLNFGQPSNMQARFSTSGFSIIAIQGFVTATLISIISVIVGAIVFHDVSGVVINVTFALAAALAIQYNTLLRCSKRFLAATYAEILRILVFSFAVAAAISFNILNLPVMAATMVVYYLLPYAIMASGMRSNLVVLRTAAQQAWSDRSRMFFWALSGGLTAGAWVVIRYTIAFFGAEGDLARFTSILSVCSAGVIIADILFIRVSRAIVVFAEDARRDDLLSMLQLVGATSILALAAMLCLSGFYIYFVLGGGGYLFSLALCLSLGYVVRFFYVFGQQILIARGLATYDLAGGLAMLCVAFGASLLLVPTVGLVGGGAAFVMTALAMLIVISWGVRGSWQVA